MGCIAAAAVAAAIHALLAPGAGVSGVAALLVIPHRVVTGSAVRLTAVTPLLGALVAGALVSVAGLITIGSALIAISDTLIAIASALIAIADALVTVAGALITIAYALIAVPTP